MVNPHVWISFLKSSEDHEHTYYCPGEVEMPLLAIMQEGRTEGQLFTC